MINNVKQLTLISCLLKHPQSINTLSQHSVASWLIFYQCTWVGHCSANCWFSVNHDIDRVSTTYRSRNQTRLSTDTQPCMPLIWFYYNQHFVTLILTSLIFNLDWQLADLMLVIRWLMPLMFSPVLLLTSECLAECWHFKFISSICLGHWD